MKVAIVALIAENTNKSPDELERALQTYFAVLPPKPFKVEKITVISDECGQSK